MVFIIYILGVLAVYGLFPLYNYLDGRGFIFPAKETWTLGSMAVTIGLSLGSWLTFLFMFGTLIMALFDGEFEYSPDWNWKPFDKSDEK